MSSSNQKGIHSKSLKFNFDGVIKNVFEPQFLQLGLSIEQINKQTIYELMDSLEIVNDSIQNAEKFGTYGIKIKFDSGALIAYLANGQTSSHIVLTALSTLLSRKKIILKRITSLKPNTMEDEKSKSGKENILEIIRLAKELISKGEIQAAIEQLSTSIDDEDVEAELIRLSCTLSFHSKEVRGGLVNRDTIILERNTITNSLLSIMKNWKNKSQSEKINYS